MVAQPTNDKAFTATSEAIKQLVTVSAAVLTLTLTFVKDVVKVTPSDGMRLVLLASWALLVVSILFGLFGLGAVAGELGKGDRASLGGSINKLAPAQFATFFLGIVLLSIFGGWTFWEFVPPTGSR